VDGEGEKKWMGSAEKGPEAFEVVRISSEKIALLSGNGKWRDEGELAKGK